jgi:hypothetical protein
MFCNLTSAKPDLIWDYFKSVNYTKFNSAVKTV